MRDISSAFWERLQRDTGQIADLIDLQARGGVFHWTSAPDAIIAPWSGNATRYEPFPGHTPSGIEETSDMGVSVVDFIMANTGEVFSRLVGNGDFSEAALAISRVFIDTPDLGRMSIYEGKVGDYSFTRKAITGQARNRFNGMSVQWPYYTYKDTCSWRFGGAGCGINTNSFVFEIDESAISADSSDMLTFFMTSGTLSNSFADGRFNFGRCTVTGGVNSGQVRTIRVHIGDAISLSHPLSINSFADIVLSIHPGCRKRLIDDCHSLYNNVENFLGFPWIPIQEQAVF